ncbi:MAG: hypothetical protein MK295_09360, partial [Pseudomonadales bacterium]|nr:hypothetical protein [Pseudomonadales bacterium]
WAICGIQYPEIILARSLNPMDLRVKEFRMNAASVNTQPFYLCIESYTYCWLEPARPGGLGIFARVPFIR